LKIPNEKNLFKNIGEGAGTFQKYQYQKRQRKNAILYANIILATQEAEIRRIAVRSQPRQIVP
jgi:hypothetical protein